MGPHWTTVFTWATVAPGTSRATRLIAAINWVMVSWVATASSSTVESNARRVFPVRELTAEEAVALGHGQRVPATGAAGLHAAIGPGDRLVALVEDGGPIARVSVGFPPS